MVHSPSDRELLDAYKAGNDAAFQRLWDRHAGALRRFLRSHFGPDIACDDLLQEAFLSLSQNAGLLRNPGVVRSYLMIAVRRLGFIERRKVNRREMVELDAARHVEGPIVDHDLRETLGTVYEALGRLSPRKRAAFVHCMEEHTVPESAAKLGVSTATVQRDVRAARRFALRCLAARSSSLAQLRQSSASSDDGTTGRGGPAIAGFAPIQRGC
jgi:RNA polymerase sigma-70 factor (ECF subfamily)